MKLKIAFVYKMVISMGFIINYVQMPKARDYGLEIGKKFGRYTFVEVLGGYPTKAVVECECGNKRIVAATQVINGYTNSCGCLMKDTNSRHGLYGTRFYRIWDSIKKRCENQKHIHYSRYGGSGIRCEFKDFIEFKDKMYSDYIEHVKKYGEKDTSIDRIDSTKGYNKANCKRATRIEQNSHKACNIKYDYEGEQLTLNEIARRRGLNINTLKSRKNNGWSINEVIYGKL